MQKIFSDFLVGRSTEQIAADLRVNNIPCKNGRAQWDSSSVRYILRNEKYTGNSKWQKYYTPSTFPFHCKINAGETQCYSSIPESRRCLLHGQHPSACPLTHPETPWYIFQNHVHVPPQVCGICKPKRFPVFPRKRSDLLQMLLYRLLMSLRIFRFCVVLHRCLLRSRLHQFYDIRCMHPGQHILYFGTLNDRHFSIPCAKPKRLCSSQTGDPRSMRGRGSKRVLLAIEPPDFD